MRLGGAEHPHCTLCTKHRRTFVLTQLPPYRARLPLETSASMNRRSSALRTRRAPAVARLMRTVKLHPQAVGLFPFRARQARGAVHVVPVRRVMPFQLGNAPFIPARQN